MNRVMIITSVPAGQGDAVREALGKAGAGVWGEYTYCSFSCKGTGRFLPSESARPNVGERGIVNIVEEERIELTCDREVAKNAITAMREVHPYEEPVITIHPLFEENEL